MFGKNNRLIWIIIGISIILVVLAGAIMVLGTYGIIAVIAVLALAGIVVSVIYKSYLGAIWILAALPFERLMTVDIGGMTLKPIHGVLAAVLVGWLIGIISRNIKTIAVPMPFILALLFYLVGLWSLDVSIDPERTMMVILFWLVALVGFFLVLQLLTTEIDLRRALVFLVFASGVLALFGFYQIAGDMVGLPTVLTGLRPGYDKTTFGLPRVHGTLPEPLYYASYLFVPLFLSITYFLYGGVKNYLKRSTALIIALAILINVVLTFSRGAFLGLAVSGALLIIWQYRQFFKLKNIIVVLSLLLFGAILIWGYFKIAEPRAIDEVYSHLSLNKKESESVVMRLKAINIAYESWQNNPWRGIGLGSYGYLELESRGELAVSEGYYPIVNNQYLETLVETGLLGAIFFGLLILSLLGRSIRAWFMCQDNFERASLAGLTLGFIGILVQYLTFSTIYIIYIWVFIGLLVAVQEIIFNSKFKSQNAK